MDIKNQINSSYNDYICHCCGSSKVEYIQHYILRRSQSVSPMYFCNTCESVSIDYPIVKYHYPISNSRDAIEFHKRIKDRNIKWSLSLLSQLEKLNPQKRKISSIIDIGCGIGTLLSVASDRNIKAIGYEIEPLAFKEACKDLRVEMHSELFDRTSEAQRNSLVCCIAVLEHLEKPNNLLCEIAEYCIKSNSMAYIFVPLLSPDWKSYLNLGVHEKGNPFFDNEEHISHYSRISFEKSFEKAFGKKGVIITAGGWAGYLYSGN